MWLNFSQKITHSLIRCILRKKKTITFLCITCIFTSTTTLPRQLSAQEKSTLVLMLVADFKPERPHLHAHAGRASSVTCCSAWVTQSSKLLTTSWFLNMHGNNVYLTHRKVWRYVEFTHRIAQRTFRNIVHAACNNLKKIMHSQMLMTHVTHCQVFKVYMMWSHTFCFSSIWSLLVNNGAFQGFPSISNNDITICHVTCVLVQWSTQVLFDNVPSLMLQLLYEFFFIIIIFWNQSCLFWVLNLK